MRTRAAVCDQGDEVREAVIRGRASLQRDLSVVGFAVGGAAVLAGFVWWWFGGGPARSVALRPLPGGATLGWSF